MYGLWSDNPTLLLQAALDAAAEKQRVAAHNMANVNTPNYFRKEVVFSAELEAAKNRLALAVTNPRHLPEEQAAGKPYRVVEDTSGTMRTDGSNVDVDREMVLMVMNHLHYNALAQALSGRYAKYRYVISEGRVDWLNENI